MVNPAVFLNDKYPGLLHKEVHLLAGEEVCAEHRLTVSVAAGPTCPLLRPFSHPDAPLCDGSRRPRLACSLRTTDL